MNSLDTPKTTNSRSVYALHILHNRREYGTVHSTVELIKPCGKSENFLLGDLYSTIPPKESSHSHTKSSRSQPTQLTVTCKKADIRGTYTNRTRHCLTADIYSTRSVHKPHLSWVNTRSQLHYSYDTSQIKAS